MDESIKVSVIIPVYAVEKYIIECVESVQKQSYKNLEIILIDDGSPDQSPEICDELAENDDRIKVIHKNNGGTSDARNRGMQVATGKYIAFLDGDDMWDDEGAIERLIKRVKITNPDVLNFSYKKYYENTGEKIPYFYNYKEMPLTSGNKEKQLDYLTRYGLYISSPCNKLIRRELLNENMQFCEGVYSEDIDWCARLMVHAKSMDFVCENFYCYRQRKNSITHTIDKKKCEDLQNNILKCIYTAELVEEKEKKYLRRYTAYQYGTFFKVQALCEDVPAENIKHLSRYRWILSYHCNNKKLIILYVGCYLLGYKNTCKLIRAIYKVKRK